MLRAPAKVIVAAVTAAAIGGGGINRDFIDSLVQAAALHHAKAELRPAPGMCRVRIITA